MVSTTTRSGVSRRDDPVGREQLAGGLDAVHLRHPDVHQHHVGLQLVAHRDRLEAVAGDTDDLHPVLRVDDRPDALAEELLVVDQHDPDHAAPRTGTHAVAVNVTPPASSRRRTSSRPPTASRRRRMPSMPWPGCGVVDGVVAGVSGAMGAQRLRRVVRDRDDVADLDAQLALPVALDGDRDVPTTVLDGVGEHLLQDTVGDGLELGRQRLRPTDDSGLDLVTARPHARRPGCRGWRRGPTTSRPACSVRTCRTSCREVRADVAIVAIVSFSLSLSASSTYCADSA